MDNAARDKKYGKPDPVAKVDTSELADKVCLVCLCYRALANAHQAPNFRYVP